MIELALDENTIARLKKIADDEDLSVQELAEQIIRQFIQQEKHRTLQRELIAFQAMRATLLARHPDDFVAIYHGRVVDHDSDQKALFKRIDHAYPGDPVLIKQVLPEPNTGYPQDIERVDMGVSPDDIVSSVYPHLET